MTKLLLLTFVFFSQKVTIQAKFIIKRIALSFIVEGEYDISNPISRQTTFERKEPHLLQPFHQTCYTGIVFGLKVLDG